MGGAGIRRNLEVYPGLGQYSLLPGNWLSWFKIFTSCDHIRKAANWNDYITDFKRADLKHTKSAEILYPPPKSRKITQSFFIKEKTWHVRAVGTASSIYFNINPASSKTVARGLDLWNVTVIDELRKPHFLSFRPIISDTEFYTIIFLTGLL